MPSLFSRIAAGEIPCYKVAETPGCLAFLDIQPLAKGHTLVIPKREVDYLFDLDAELYQSLMLFARQVATAQKKVIPCLRIGVAVIGLEVPHAHVHLIPMNAVSDLNFSRPRLSFSKTEMEETARKISQAFEL